MTTYFISRHPGAVDWATSEGHHVDEQLAHFDPKQVKQGDKVLGTLPINLVAEVNERGGDYYHLSLDLPSEIRGKEITAEDMKQYGARLEHYSAKRLDR
ncbi:CRISPR-associated protein Csx16 [Leucothrix arctica]|uniref:CRISPR-associated protein Csx16 n=1 Tax=Leucothrix arctica TaxID=1481894 RepID=A0A317CSM0_9GAMM|nr:CRISPR-associated protein Csx16 [Leucothrix arctica]PWQ99322.1 CRISPR-associated protein Csx16 [Leucothrix arctica]